MAHLDDMTREQVIAELLLVAQDALIERAQHITVEARLTGIASYCSNAHEMMIVWASKAYDLRQALLNGAKIDEI